ncbi:hypothetical protein SCHPADRAFT_941249 [Schizopora paradoxa]|uniref:MYND-type domain-containing protein n=1 Tax=Schizopora paradoxa TaxID=27342 RepID=A0A0H2RKD1_9AGAM|nr:hypothetical protein SCHPADRAFT_941249 [Schizopora paradoxa]
MPPEDLDRYLSEPRQCITSAAGDSPESLEDLRTVVFNGGHTPDQFTEEALAMLFSHLSSANQSSFNPAGPIPPPLRPYETKALLSMAGIYTILTKYNTPQALGAAPIGTLVDNWPKIRKWIQHFFYRALARTAPPSQAPITSDEVRFLQMGEDWNIFNMVVVILTFIRQDYPFFKSVVSKDGTFTLVMKLWARTVRLDPALTTTPHTFHRKATLLFSDCLQILRGSGKTDGMSAQLLKEMGGDARAIAAFLTRPIRDAAKTTHSEFNAQSILLGPSMQLIHRLLDGVTGGVDPRPVFGQAFFANSTTNPRPFMTKILVQYSARCNVNNPPFIVLEILRCAFQLCISMTFYQDAIDFVVKLLDGGLLDVYANMVQALAVLTDLEIIPAAVLLKHNTATFLSHECVIVAAKNALHRLEKERKADYMALKETSSGLKDAWIYFAGHAFERAILKGVYDAKFHKEDKLSCAFCDVRMNERTLKKCSGCKFIHYCSQECQQKDWKGHKEQCKLLAKNLEVYKINTGTYHFFEHLVRSDVKRHMPGLNLLAQHDSRTRGADALIAYSADYTVAPPIFSVFPADYLADDSKYVELGIASNPQSQAIRRELLEKVRAAKGTRRVVQVEVCGHAGTPIVSFHTIGREDFAICSAPVPVSFNSERPRATDGNGNMLAVQSDWTDIVMTDAIYGRKITHDEFHSYISGHAHHLGRSDQEKTVPERVDDAVRRRKDQAEAPCCRDRSGRSIC